MLGLLWGLRTAGFVLARLALAAIAATYSLEVVCRYLFDAPTSWSADLVSYLLCVLVFTMMPQVTASGSQVAVTVIVDALSERRREILMRVIHILGFLACAAMGYFAFGETTRQILRDIQILATNPVPKWWISIWIGIGFALSALEFLRLAVTGGGSPDRPGDATPAGG
ncbi:MAG: TRAP transporter small permease [Minwuia sp.]|uniref:TRAP transporter small permease n=1 Tax=Minwuia sp. TaxID=2493630 RepID=UPI003A83F2AE